MATQSRPSKLTLRLDSDLIDRAKRYARKRGTSVSQMVSNYFQALTQEPPLEADEDWKADLPPITRRLVSKPPAPPVDAADYWRYLEEKHR